jgi:small subunit ribosomal protein S1
MVQDEIIRDDCEEAPELDEGWWASVLNDENANSDEDSDGNSRVFSQPLIGSLDWEAIQTHFQQDDVVNLTVHGFNRGGLLVQGEGIQGFVPISHIVDMPVSQDDDERHELMAAYVGKTLHLKVIECEPSCDRVVLSERAARAGEGKRKELFGTLKPGSVVTGTVTNITDFGAFVDLGGVEGLIHVSELSWGRVDQPGKFLTVGEQVKVFVLTVNEETSRIALSMKRLTSNPWDVLTRRYAIGDVVEAEITSIMKFGMFARLNEGVEGLVHISCISTGNERPNLQKLFFVGQKINVKILHIECERRRLGLGLVSAE